jgi:predicted nucleic acid-binding protein
VRAVTDRLSAVLDANVLYPFLVRDVLLSFAHAGLYRPLWTDRINEEWSLNLIEKLPEREAQIKATVQVMNGAFPEALVGQYEDLIESLQLPDIDDRHVLAAAIRGDANIIVTENLKDFPSVVLERYGLDALTTDEFVLNVVETHPVDTVDALRRMRLRYTNPPHDPEQLLQAMLRCGLARTVAFLAPQVESL